MGGDSSGGSTDPVTTSAVWWLALAGALGVTTAHVVAMRRVADKVKRAPERFPQAGFSFW